MCGIVGYISHGSEMLKIGEAMASIHHRGPDRGDFVDEQHENWRVVLGHRRLSIIDLSEGGSQPMTIGHVTMVFNGEVYNFQELREKHFGNETFHSSSDTEVVLRLYLKLGVDFVHELNGDFAIAILDRQRDELLLVRDRLGIKPLYVYSHDEDLAFGSEIKVFREGGIDLKLDKTAISPYLVFKYTPGNATMFRDVERLEPGSIMCVDLHSKKITRQKFWDIREKREVFKGSYNDAKTQLRELMERAVRRRLIADVPIANYLSGGLDSTIIASYLRGQDNVHYCAVKSEKDLKAEGTSSDGRYAMMLAEEWGLNLEEIPIGLDELNESQIESAVYSCDDLIADGSIIPAMLIAQKAGQDHRVVLSGMGADELFFGYNGHYLLRLTQMAGRVPALKKALTPVLQKVDAGKGPFKAYRRYLQKWGNNLGKPFEAGRYSVVGDVDSALRIHQNQGEAFDVYRRYFDRDGDLFDHVFEFELENFLVKNLHYLDRSSMAYGLESRVPFLDHEVVEFAAGLPSEYKLDWKMKSKRILKDAYADVVPDYVTKRRKAGFGMPLRSLLSNQTVIDKLLPLDFLSGFEGFDMDEVKQIIASHQSGKQDQSALIYALISFRFWHQKFF